MDRWFLMLTRSFPILLVSPAINGMSQLILLVSACPGSPTAKNQRMLGGPFKANLTDRLERMALGFRHRGSPSHQSHTRRRPTVLEKGSRETRKRRHFGDSRVPPLLLLNSASAMLARSGYPKTPRSSQPFPSDPLTEDGVRLWSYPNCRNTAHLM